MMKTLLEDSQSHKEELMEEWWLSEEDNWVREVELREECWRCEEDLAKTDESKKQTVL